MKKKKRKKRKKKGSDKKNSKEEMEKKSLSEGIQVGDGYVIYEKVSVYVGVYESVCMLCVYVV